MRWKIIKKRFKIKNTMFNFFHKNSKRDLSDIETKKYLLILYDILNLLNDLNLSFQVEIIQNIIDTIKKNNFKEFKEKINSVDMWGGSGAVWEIHIEEYEKEKKFKTLIIKLIELMEDTKVIGKGIVQIKKYFLKQ